MVSKMLFNKLEKWVSIKKEPDNHNKVIAL